MAAAPSILDAHATRADELARRLDVDVAVGLSEDEAAQRLRRHGPNALRQRRPRGAWRILGDQFRSLVMALLLAAMGVSWWLGERVEAAAIAVLIVLNVVIGFIMELRATRSMESLLGLVELEARVRRGGTVLTVRAAYLVPGDVVLLEGGDVLTADVRLVGASRLALDESVLTGESMPVGKRTGLVDRDAPLYERANMLFKGTKVTRGSAEGLVVGTGANTELGRIASLVATAEGETTPLERRLERLARRLIVAALGVAGVVTVIGVVRGAPAAFMVQTGIALAIAAVPEGLPIVATLALARGMLRLSRRDAIVRRLAAVETLGSTSVICTDKTGTLTENRMTAEQVVTPSGDGRQVWSRGAGPGRPLEPGAASQDDVLRRLVEAGSLCNNASWSAPDVSVGDPMEVALLRLAAETGVRRETLAEDAPEVREDAFDPETRMMATVHRLGGGGFRVAVKGAPEAVLAVSTMRPGPGGAVMMDEIARAAWQLENERLAESGLRVLALAERSVEDATADVYADLVFLGLVGMVDPPREDVRDAVDECQSAGVKVVMVTGDQAPTAMHVAKAVGIMHADKVRVGGPTVQELETLSEAERAEVAATGVFARVSPEQKLGIVALHQGSGSVVAMTGDGVNDAPALGKADIGIAMGTRGTQVARDAADIVLRDDAFTSIVAAVRQGRIIFTNIRRFAYYLLSCNMGEIAIVGLAVGAGAPLPLLPLQILYLNLVTDVFPALALGFSGGDPAEMRHPPRPRDEAFLTGRHWRGIMGYAGLFALAVLAAFTYAVHAGTVAEAVTVAFLTLAFAQLWHVFNMRESGTPFRRSDVVRNPYVWGALVLCTLLILVAAWVPPLAGPLGLVSVGIQGWGLALAASLLPLVIGQAAKSVPRRGDISRATGRP